MALRSEWERKWRNFAVFCLWELVLQRCQELRIDLDDEATDVLNNDLEIGIRHARSFLHFFIPNRCGLFLQALCWQNQTCCGNFRRFVFEKTGVEKCDFLNVLCEVENLVVCRNRVRKSSKALKESVCARHSDLKLEHAENVNLHLEHFGPRELVFTHLKQIFEVRRVNFFVLCGDE